MKNIHDDDFELQDENLISRMDRAKILISVIPVVLIIIILAVTMIVNEKKEDPSESEDLQQSIMDYADETNSTNNTLVKTEELPQTDTKLTTPEKEVVSKDEISAEEDQGNAEPSSTPYGKIMDTDKTDYSKVSYDRDEQLKEMMSYWADNNQKALDDLANLDRFKAMSWALRDTTDFYYYGDRNVSGIPEGKGIAVYADNQYYYGDWKDGVRSGNGTWIHYHIHNTANKNDLYLYHQYTGSWAEDLPEGEGSEHYDYEMSLLKENTGYNNNLIGSYSKGLVNGDFYLTNIYPDGNVREWYAQAEHGSWIYKSENKDKAGRGPVYVSNIDPNDYIWMLPKENKNVGVPCLISKKNSSSKN